MRGYSFLIIGLFVIVSCDLSNQSPDDVNSNLYEWVEITNFKDAWITALAVSEEDNLYLAQSKKLFIQKAGDRFFNRISTPDSAKIVRIRKFNEKLFIIGDVYRQGGGPGVWGRNVSYLYVSTDEGNNWEEVIGGFVMQDVTYHDNRIHIGRKHGVTTVDINTGEEFRNRFIESKLSDHIEEIETSKNGEIVVASHDGLHISRNNGEDWTKLSKRIRKENDWISSIEFDTDNKLYALQSSRTYILDVASGNYESFKNGYSNDQHKIVDEIEIVKVGGSMVRIANLNVMKFTDISPDKDEGVNYNFEYVDVFSDGRIIIGGVDELFIGKKVEQSTLN